jgi:hypothetical protein
MDTEEPTTIPEMSECDPSVLNILASCSMGEIETGAAIIQAAAEICEAGFTLLFELRRSGDYAVVPRGYFRVR